MATLPELEAARAALEAQLNSPIKRVTDGGSTVEFSDAGDVRRRLAEVNAQISAFTPSRRMVRRVYPVRAW
jgi:tRNA U34 5-methylaminomethyl-2-thiouridine-forming methyltransferase MnmC